MVLGLVIFGFIVLTLGISFIVGYLCYNRRRKQRVKGNGFRHTRHFSGYMQNKTEEQAKKSKYEEDFQDRKKETVVELNSNDELYAKIELPKIRRSKHEENLTSPSDDGIKPPVPEKRNPDDDTDVSDDDGDANRPTSICVNNDYENVDRQQILSVQDLLKNNAGYVRAPSIEEHDSERDDDLSHYSEEYPEDRYSTQDTGSAHSSSSRRSRQSGGKSPGSSSGRSGKPRQTTTV